MELSWDETSEKNNKKGTSWQIILLVIEESENINEIHS